MPATDYQGFAIASSIVGRGNVAMDANNSTTTLELEIEAFQMRIAERFLQLSAEISSADVVDIMSLRWVRNLLDAFLCCQEDFRALLSNHRSAAARPPMDRMVVDYFDRSVKALDVCNAIRDGIEQIRHWHGLLDIVLAALAGRRAGVLGEGQFRRAKKALVDLAIAMLDEKDSAGTAAAIAHRNRSFGRNTGSSTGHSSNNRKLGHFRSLSWSVSRSWSAARQLQAMASNVAAPRSNEVVATGGLAVAVFAANSVVMFTMWALVAAIPCQDRGGLQVHFSAPRQLPWATPMMVIHDRIVEESKRRERRNACGLLREIHQIERCSRLMSDLADSVQFPLSEEKAVEIQQRVEELWQVCEALKEGLDPLERQVRDVFNRIVRSRTEGLDSLGRTNFSE